MEAYLYGLSSVLALKLVAMDKQPDFEHVQILSHNMVAVIALNH